MNTKTRLFLFGICLHLCSSVVSSLRAETIEVHNNHPFPIHMPWVIRDTKLKGDSGWTNSGPVQQTGCDLTIMIDIPASSTKTLDLTPVPAPSIPFHQPPLAIKPAGNGISISYQGKDLGILTWSAVLYDVPKPARGDEDTLSSGKPPMQPKPLSLSFKQTNAGELFTTYTADAVSAGLGVTVALDVYESGFLDIHTTVINESAPRKQVYAAVVTRWAQPKNLSRTFDYNNSIAALKEGSSTPWRKGEGKHLFVGRGLDWVNSTFESASVVWMNEFAPSFTVHRDATAKTPSEWLGANSAQLDQEAYVDGGALYHVTELAHGSIKSYRSRLEDYVLPDKSQPMTFAHRLVFSAASTPDERADQLFVAYTTYNAQNPGVLNLGVPFVRFGTAYFPYSTLGENFIRFKLPGMSQDSYWPLAADVVKNYSLFADDIRRDLRIAKAMGFESIRLHHFEMLYTDDKSPVHVDPKDRESFLDFFFDELKSLHMTALLDVKLKPEEIAGLLARYRPLIDGVEIDNEVLIFGIQDRDVQYWKDCYAAVKNVAPDMPVHWTAHTNTGAFVRLKKLGVPFDRIGEHAYMDSREAIPSSRDFALQVANFASRIQKPPVITEWNWRFLTRMTPENRAGIYAPIFENVFKARAMPEIYQFQFQDSLAMSPLSLKGIRHYELLNLSRHPRPEAGEFERLVTEYSDPNSPFVRIATHHTAGRFSTDGVAHGKFPISSPAGALAPIHLAATGESFDPGVVLALDNESDHDFTLAPGQSHDISFSVKLPENAPAGFYHVFLRLQDDHGGIRYAWAEFRHYGDLKIDKEAKSKVAYGEGALDMDFNRPTEIVYGDDCPVLELEAAWVVYQTLEAATGRPTRIFTAGELPQNPKAIPNVIYVGTPKSLPKNLHIDQPDKQCVSRAGDSNTLIISGPTSQDAALAAMDFTMRYWKTAKDSACRRVPLVEREIPKGGDVGQLP